MLNELEGDGGLSTDSRLRVRPTAARDDTRKRDSFEHGRGEERDEAVLGAVKPEEPLRMIRVGQEVIDDPDRVHAAVFPLREVVILFRVNGVLARPDLDGVRVLAVRLFNRRHRDLFVFEAWGDALLQPSADAALGKVFRISEKGSLFLSFKEPVHFDALPHRLLDLVRREMLKEAEFAELLNELVPAAGVVGP